MSAPKADPVINITVKIGDRSFDQELIYTSELRDRLEIALESGGNPAFVLADLARVGAQYLQDR
jgi:hypothetical protein